MEFEAGEYRRLLVVCRERVVGEMERADRAERTIEVLLTALRKLVEAFNLDIYRTAAQFADAEVAEFVYRQACELIQQIEREGVSAL
jgi:hypothetical protein